jgi:hypothetical protein
MFIYLGGKPNRKQISLTSLIFSSETLLTHVISETIFRDLPSNTALTQRATQKKGRKNGMHFKKGYDTTIDLYGGNNLFNT